MAELVERLVADLATDGTITTPDPAGRGLLITGFRGGEVSPPVQLHVGESDLREYLESASASAAPVFPDVPPDVAAHRLLLVNIDEALATSGRDIMVTGGEVRWQPPAYHPEPPPPGELAWESLRRPGGG